MNLSTSHLNVTTDSATCRVAVAYATDLCVQRRESMWVARFQKHILRTKERAGG